MNCRTVTTSSSVLALRRPQFKAKTAAGLLKMIGIITTLSSKIIFNSSHLFYIILKMSSGFLVYFILKHISLQLALKLTTNIPRPDNATVKAVVNRVLTVHYLTDIPALANGNNVGQEEHRLPAETVTGQKIVFDEKRKVFVTRFENGDIHFTGFRLEKNINTFMFFYYITQRRICVNVTPLFYSKLSILSQNPNHTQMTSFR